MGIPALGITATGGSASSASSISLRQVVAPSIALGGDAGLAKGGRRFPGRYDIDGAPGRRDNGGLNINTLLLIGGALLALKLSTG